MKKLLFNKYFEHLRIVLYPSSWKNTYFDFTGSTAKELGAFGLPTTLFFNAGGKLVDSHMGELSEASLQYYLDPLRKKAINSSD